MKMNKKLVRKIKRLFKPYNLAIFACIIIIIVSLAIIIKPNGNNFSQKANNNENITTSQEESNKEEIKEKKAREIAKKRFEKLGERNVDENSLTVSKIQRDGDLYYYICSLNNTIEINVYSGKVTRLNTAVVDE